MQSMNLNRIASVNGINMKAEHAKIEPKLCKFVAIIQGTKQIKACCKSHDLVLWLNFKDVELNEKFKNVREYHEFIFPTLELSSADFDYVIEIRKQTALQYAKILEQYAPKEDGNLNLSFNYVQLVSIIKKVFYNHIRSNSSLFTRGIRFATKDESFVAKVEQFKVYIIHDKVESTLGKGGNGTVVAVYEISTCKILALKLAENKSERKHLFKEIHNLNALHRCAKKEKKSTEGLQDPPLTFFNIQHDINPLVGFLGPKYGIDLIFWADGSHSNTERLAMCKHLIRAYKNKIELDYWHGDIKPDNVLTTDKGLVIIDWGGSIPFKDAAEKCVGPKTMTDKYVNALDKKCILNTMISANYDEPMQKQLIKYGNALELYSLAIVLYMTLTGEYPFLEYFDEDLKELAPNTFEGLPIDRRMDLINQNYNMDIIKILMKMLSYQEKNRYSTHEAISVWESIDDTTGKINK